LTNLSPAYRLNGKDLAGLSKTSGFLADDDDDDDDIYFRPVGPPEGY
jgi:hypothetical protein